MFLFIHCMFTFLRNCQIIFQSICPILHILPMSPQSHQHLILSLLFMSHSDRWEVTSLYDFTFYYPNDWRCRKPQHMLICHILFSDRNFHVFAYFLIGLFFKMFCFTLFYCCSITVVCIFPTIPPTPAKPTSLPCFHPLPWFCPCVLYSCSWKPFPPLSPPTFPLVTVRLFSISMSLVIFSLLSSFVD